MSIVNYRRTPTEIFRGVLNRTLQVIAFFTFPCNVTIFVHRLRGVKIGKQTYMGRLVSLDDRSPELIEIGNGVAVSTGVVIFCHQRDLTNYKPGMYAMHCPFKTGKVKIGDGAHLGVGSIIMPGVTVGEGAIIGEGAVVTRDVPPYSVAVGVPAKIIKSFKDES